MRWERMVLVLALMAPAAARAEDKSSGCGLGQQILGTKNSLFMTTLKSTTDGYSSLTNLGALSSGTLGCTKHSLVDNRARAKAYAIANIDQISFDAARGGGEYLSAFGRTLGCRTEAVSSFEALSHEKFQDLFLGTQRDPGVLADRAAAMIETTPHLAAGCGLT